MTRFGGEPRSYAPPGPPPERFFAGLDLGQAGDYTALAVLQRSGPGPADLTGPKPAYTVRHAERYPLGTSYPTVVEDVTAKMKSASVPGCALVVDYTGVGRPVVQQFWAKGRAIAVTITGGHSVNWDADEGAWNVPKRELVAVLQLLFQAGRITIPALPNRDVLKRELLSFRVKVNTRTGNESFEAWRERDHDDLVLAVALAAWAGERALADELVALPRPGTAQRR